MLAALQVALVHAAFHLGYDRPWLQPLSLFPGVPVFFFVSGFLIYQSWGNIKTDKLKTFLINRTLRLYPALVFCFAFSLVTLALSGYLSSRNVTLREMLGWTIAQLTVFQFYNPSFLREYGTGVVNGSLWTISVELQFYFLTPIIWSIYHHYHRLAIGAFVMFVALNAVQTHLAEPTSLYWKLFSVSFAPWIYMFLVGAYVSTDKDLQNRILKLNGFVLLAIYLVVYFLGARLNLGADNGINILSYLALAALVLKAAFTRPTLSNRILRRNDISYGIYIFHMPIVNLLIFHGSAGTTWAFVVSILSTFIMAGISWWLVEMPSLRLKKATLRSS